MKTFREQMQNQLDKMVKTGKLFRSEIPGNEVWNYYINSFEDDPIFRDPSSSTHNCNLCNNFIRRYGNIVAIDDDYKIITLWDFIPEENEFTSVNIKIESILKRAKIESIFTETFESLNSLPYEKTNKSQKVYKLGIESNIKRYTKEEADLYPNTVKENQIIKFEHISLNIPEQFVDKSGSSIESIIGRFRDNKEVFEKGLNIISIDTLELIIDLINQGSLLDGVAYLKKVKEFLSYAKEYKTVKDEDRDNWLWINSYNNSNAKFKNTLIGVLATELSEGMELNKACENWNKRVDPANYMKATAPITKKQIEEARIFIDTNGYTSSFQRRMATIDDIKASEILHMNSEGGFVNKDIHLFDKVTPTKSTQHKRSEFDKVEEVSIEKFMNDILPGCTSIEAFLLNKHEQNMVTLITAENKDSKQIFKWNNNFSWTFNGNLAGKSYLKEAVKSLGGKIDGVLRASISWNEDGRSIVDFDLHAIEPNNHKIYFRSNKGINSKTPMSGYLDIDMIRPSKLGVENITWTDKSKMQDGNYKFFIKNYDGGRNNGFKAEIEFEDQIYSYEITKNCTGVIKIATVNLNKGVFTIKHDLNPIDGYEISKEFYNLETNKFHKVNLVCLSPNHWGDNEVGNKHYFFFLEGAKCGMPIRSFHNENLKTDLLSHRKVMEVLANTTMVESDTTELSGLGFNSTVKDELILRLKGSHKRIIKVKF